MRYTFSTLNERQRRLFAASEALKLGRGGISYMAPLLECHLLTIERGLSELRHPDSLLPPLSSAKKRGGRQRCLTLFPGIDKAFLQIVDPHTASYPHQDRVLCTNLSRPSIAEQLLRRGFRVSVTVASQLLQRHLLRSRKACKTLPLNTTLIAIRSSRSSPTTAPLSCILRTPS